MSSQADTNPTISYALSNATQQLQDSSSSARVDAEVLLCYTLNCNTAHLAAWPEKELTTTQLQQYIQLIEQRESGTPVAYLTGKREFWSLELSVSLATLIPRPETETLVDFVLEHFDNQKKIRLLDLGTGSGAIALAIASERPNWMITATDISDSALAIAQNNAAHHQISNINFCNSHWFEALSGESFDIIISNPPYIAKTDPHLSMGDVRFEPPAALAAGIKGLDDIEVITSMAPQYLHNDGWLILEHGYDQKTPVFDCYKTAGFEQISQQSDLSGQPRMTAGCYISN